MDAFDACPQLEARGAGAEGTANGSSREKRTENEFHGDCPSFTTVQRGGPGTLADAKWQGHTLLLCYPPKGKPMGAQAVRHFCGKTIAHVGEWRGDTGDASFETQLAQGWELVSRLPLPCWGDTIEDLTIWTRRPTPLPTPPLQHPVLACDACGKPAALRPGSTSSPAAAKLRRCRYCRLAVYCSAACARAGAPTHASYHNAKLVTIRRPLDFDGRDYYAVM